MPENRVTVAIPTLAADSKLLDCVHSLCAQTLQDFEVTIVDNSGLQLVRRRLEGAARFAASRLQIIENARNLGFGGAVNQVYRQSRGPYLATLNDDAVAHPRWLEELLAAIEARPDAGMCATQVRLMGTGQLDSAGMLIAGDGSSKQRGHRAPWADFDLDAEVLLPSGSAALYRRAMLDEIGGFDESFFLYCEDTDLGLRARWAGWKCWYAPAAVVDHHYSHTAGRVSPLKAYYVERNRLSLVVKNFPLKEMALAPFLSIGRYCWHLVTMAQGRGSAARFQSEGNAAWMLAVFVARAHGSLLLNWRQLWRKRRAIRDQARISSTAFRSLLEAHSIGIREVAEL